jgi:hypothetical protein
MWKLLVILLSVALADCDNSLAVSLRQPHPNVAVSLPPVSAEPCAEAGGMLALANMDGRHAAFEEARTWFERCRKGGTLMIPARDSGWVALYCDLKKQVVNSGNTMICTKK